MKVTEPLVFIILLGNLYVKGLANPKHNIYFNELSSCECGKHDEVAPRIVGGEETKPNQYPWMVAICRNGHIFCGGTLINDRYVLTAGHCLIWSKKENVVVVFGLHNSTQKRRGAYEGVAVEIESFIVHEDFSSDYLHDTNDVGLIKMKTAIEFNSRISPICLPKYENDYVGSPALVIGWGRISEKGASSKFLKKANVTVMSNAECKSVPALGPHVTDSMMCAYRFKSDACQGDSGGPLTYETSTGQMEQIGVVSWGIGCANPGMPGIYTKITHYLEWIALHTLDAWYCKNRL